MQLLVSFQLVLISKLAITNVTRQRLAMDSFDVMLQTMPAGEGLLTGVAHVVGIVKVHGAIVRLQLRARAADFTAFDALVSVGVGGGG